MQTTHEDKAMKPDILPSRDPAYAENPKTPEEVAAERQVAIAERAFAVAARERIKTKPALFGPHGKLIGFGGNLHPGDKGYDVIMALDENVRAARVALGVLQQARSQRVLQHMLDHEGEGSTATGDERAAWDKVTKAAERTVKAARTSAADPSNEGAHAEHVRAADAEVEARVEYNAQGRRRAVRGLFAMEEANYAGAELKPSISTGKKR